MYFLLFILVMVTLIGLGEKTAAITGGIVFAAAFLVARWQSHRNSGGRS